MRAAQDAEGSGWLETERWRSSYMERCETGSRGFARQRAAHLQGLSILPRHALRVLGRLAGHEQEGCWGHAVGWLADDAPRAYN